MANANPSRPSVREKAPNIEVREDNTVKLPPDYKLPEGIEAAMVRRDPATGQLYAEKPLASGGAVRTYLFNG